MMPAATALGTAAPCALPKQPAPVRRIGIIGDVHGELTALSFALEHLAHADCILCTGDIVDGPGCADACARLLQRYSVITVAGNHERWLFTNKARDIPDADDGRALQETTLSFLVSLPQCVELATTSGRLLLSHGVGRHDMAQVWPGSDRLGPQRCAALDALIASGRYRYFVHGHIHYRLVLEFQRMTLINAGALKRNLQPDFKPGFMLLDTDTKQLQCYHLDAAGKVLEKAVIPLAEKTCARRIWRNTQEFDGNWDVFRMANYMTAV